MNQLRGKSWIGLNCLAGEGGPLSSPRVFFLLSFSFSLSRRSCCKTLNEFALFSPFCPPPHPNLPPPTAARNTRTNAGGNPNSRRGEGRIRRRAADLETNATPGGGDDDDDYDGNDGDCFGGASSSRDPRRHRRRGRLLLRPGGGEPGEERGKGQQAQGVGDDALDGGRRWTAQKNVPACHKS